MNTSSTAGAPPSKLTPRVHDVLVASVAAGLPYGVSAVRAGVSEAVLWEWIDRGRQARRRDEEMAGELLPCARCLAVGTELCVSKQGNRLRKPHAGRLTPPTARDPILVALVEALEKAEQDAHAAALASIQTSGRGRPFRQTVTKSYVTEDGETVSERTTTEGVKVEWQAAAWFLERRYPHMYALRRVLDLPAGAPGQPVDDEEHERLLGSIADARAAYEAGLQDGQAAG